VGTAAGDCPCFVREQPPTPADSNQERVGNVVELSDVTGASWSQSASPHDYESEGRLPEAVRMLSLTSPAPASGMPVRARAALLTLARGQGVCTRPLGTAGEERGDCACSVYEQSPTPAAGHQERTCPQPENSGELPASLGRCHHPGRILSPPRLQFRHP